MTKQPIRVFMWNSTFEDKVKAMLCVGSDAAALTRDEWQELATLADATIQWLDADASKTLTTEDASALNTPAGIVISASELVLPKREKQP